VAGTRNASQAERNRRICLLRRNGFTYSEIAQMEDISRVRVAQVYAEHNSELAEDDGRAEIAGILEFAERKAVELINDPGYRLAPSGGLAKDGDGKPLPDKAIINEALKTLILVADRKSRLYGWDKQLLKQKMSEEEARQRAAESLTALALAVAEKNTAIEERHRREMLELRYAAQPQVVQGEVMRPDPGL
jgi:hypothetical protein